MKRLSIILLILSGSCWAQIARTGTGSATTGAATLSAVATNDLKICFAYASGSTTAPSAPAGWTTIDSGATANGGTTGALRSACNKATGTGDTGSGTWGTHTTLQCAAYSGTAVNAAADCNTTGIAKSGGIQSAKTSATVSYTLGTMSFSDNLDWVVGFAGGSAGIPAAPSDLTNIATSATAPASRLMDTNTHVASWADSTASVTSGTWLSDVVELTVATVATPSITPAAGNYTASQTVAITDSTASATICYTTDATTPTATTPGTCSHGTTYSGSFSENALVTVIALGSKASLHNSSTTSSLFTFGTAHIEVASASASSITTAAIDTTNAVLIVAACELNSTNTATTATPALSDSLGQSWTHRSRSERSNAGATLAVFIRAAYLLSPSTSNAHTFTCSQGVTTSSMSLAVIAFQSPYFSSRVFDSDCANTSTLSGSNITSLNSCDSTLTPAAASDIIASFLGANNFGSFATVSSIGSGLSLLDNVAPGSNSDTMASAYLLDGATSALNPAWAFASTADKFASTMLAFKVPPTPGSCSNFMSLLGAGCQ